MPCRYHASPYSTTSMILAHQEVTIRVKQRGQPRSARRGLLDCMLDAASDGVWKSGGDDSCAASPAALDHVLYHHQRQPLPLPPPPLPPSPPAPLPLLPLPPPPPLYRHLWTPPPPPDYDHDRVYRACLENHEDGIVRTRIERRSRERGRRRWYPIVGEGER